MVAAQNEARAAHNDQIHLEHLVLGLLSEPEALAARAILAQGVTLEAVRQTVAAVLPPEVDEVPGLILLALLELEDGTGVLAGLGVEKATAEANISRAVATSLAAHEQK